MKRSQRSQFQLFLRLFISLFFFSFIFIISPRQLDVGPPNIFWVFGIFLPIILNFPDFSFAEGRKSEYQLCIKSVFSPERWNDSLISIKFSNFFVFQHLFYIAYGRKKRMIKRLDGKWITFLMWCRFSNVLNCSSILDYIKMEKSHHCNYLHRIMKVLLKLLMHIKARAFSLANYII